PKTTSAAASGTCASPSLARRRPDVRTDGTPAGGALSQASRRCCGIGGRRNHQAISRTPSSRNKRPRRLTGLATQALIGIRRANDRLKLAELLGTAPAAE